MGKALVIGSGGREDSMGWKFAQSDNVSAVFHAPGNAGTEGGKRVNIGIDGAKKDNFEKLYNFVKDAHIDMVVVGPEAPLAAGVVDYFNERGYNRIFGPTQRASPLESDKFFSFDIMDDIGVPQANSIKCYDLEEARMAIRELSTQEGVVIKARGLTGGKGVAVCDSRDIALQEIDQHRKEYGPEVLIAERLFGQEFSVFGISDGNKISPLEISVQDHKRQLDGDQGLNTGGMGAHCPAPIAPRDVVLDVANRIMTPVVQRMKEIGREYKGFLYAGMIMTEEGPKVIEFNIRFGDPECQPAMMMLKSDLYNSLSLALDGKLESKDLEFNPGAACCVVLTSQGYPEDKYKKNLGLDITGLDAAESLPGVKVFHAGTKRDGDRILNSGGRVLGVTAYYPYLTESIKHAQKMAYSAVSRINIPGGFAFRKDIASKALSSC